MKIREALIAQAPSLALQRAAADEIAALDTALLFAISALQDANSKVEGLERQLKEERA